MATNPEINRLLEAVKALTEAYDKEMAKDVPVDVAALCAYVSRPRS